MTAVITVHGIRSDGRNNVDRLGRELHHLGHLVVDCNLGYVNLVEVATRLRSRDYQYKLARPLVDLAAAHPGAHVVAHSFGCLAALRAMERGAQFGSVFLFAPAMDWDFLFPHWGCETWDVIHCPDDRAIKVGSWLRFHDFGRMGLHGSMFAHLDERGSNHQAEITGGSDWFRHNYAFEADQLDHWTAFVDQRIAR